MLPVSHLSRLVASKALRTVPYPLLGENTLCIADSMCLAPDEDGKLALLFRRVISCAPANPDLYPYEFLNSGLQLKTLRTVPYPLLGRNMLCRADSICLASDEDGRFALIFRCAGFDLSRCLCVREHSCLCITYPACYNLNGLYRCYYAVHCTGHKGGGRWFYHCGVLGIPLNVPALHV